MSFYEAFWDCEYQPTVCFIDEMIKLKNQPKQFHGKRYGLKTDYFGKLQEYYCYMFEDKDDITICRIVSESGITIQFEYCMLGIYFNPQLKKRIDFILKSDFNNGDKNSVDVEYILNNQELFNIKISSKKGGSSIIHHRWQTKDDLKQYTLDDILDTTSELIQFLNKLDKQNKETK